MIQAHFPVYDQRKATKVMTDTLIHGKCNIINWLTKQLNVVVDLNSFNLYIRDINHTLMIRLSFVSTSVVLLVDC